MKKLVIIMIALLNMTYLMKSEEWLVSVPLKSIKLVSTKGLKHPKWFVSTFKLTNMINLSFFNKTYIGPYKDSLQLDLKNPKRWPFISIDTFCSSIGDDSLGIIFHSNKEIANKSSKFIASGTPLLLKDGSEQPIKKNGFTLAKRPRTVIGSRHPDSILIYISSGIRIVDMPNRLKKLGFKDAINLDGGGSTFLYRDSVYQYRQKNLRSYPNILTW